MLGELAAFAGLDDQALQELASLVTERTYEPGEVITVAGEPCEAVHLVLRGFVRTRRFSFEGREYVLEYVRAGEFLDLVPALDGGRSLATAEPLTVTQTLLIPCDQFRQLVRDHPSVAQSVLMLLASRVRDLSDTVEDLALHTVRARLARFLLSRQDDGARQPRHWTQEEIAAHIGTVRDVVGRTLRALARQGLIRRERGRLVVLDRTGLEREALYS